MQDDEAVPRAAIYMREVSGSPRKATLQAQRAACHSYCKECQYTVVAEFNDSEVSGVDYATRQGLRDLNDLAKTGDIDVIVVRSWDRFNGTPYRVARDLASNLTQYAIRIEDVDETEPIPAYWRWHFQDADLEAHLAAMQLLIQALQDDD